MARRPRAAGPPAANPRGAIQDWLNLVEPDGAFLTTTELLAAFPSGFEPMDPEHRTELRARVAELDDEPDGRRELRRWLLEAVLQWDDQLVDGQRIPVTATVRIAEHGVHLRPDAVLVDVDDPNRMRLGLFVWPNGTRPDRRPDVAVAGDTWPATPVQRAENWCRESGTPLALVTDDEQWVLVWAPRGAPAASCRWRTSDLADERILQSGFVSLLGARRFFAVAEDQTLERLFERAADAEAEITKGLGLSVRRSVELLVAAISRDDVATGGRVLDGVPGTEVYEASVSVLMRLVFLLFAEERRLLPAEDPLWAESYSVLTLRDDLRNAAVRDGDDALERRATAWHRLLATFRAVHGGANHDRLSLPAYGGSLFDPDRYPFLEGRRQPDHVVVDGVDLGPADDAPVGPGRPVAIDDRTVLAILDSLLNVKVRVGRNVVTQRVSYKALDVEQIGHCYEGLLDHGCAPVDELSLGLVGPEGAEPELTVTELEAHLAAGPDALCEWLADKTRCNRSASALAKDLDRRPEGIDVARLRVACGHDDATVERVLPFWGLIRTDLRGLPIVLLPGSLYVTQTSTRRNMGAQYTTKALAEEVVRYALEPLVYDPGPQNEPDPEKWRLRTPHEILDLRVCDPAVGSGAILTAAGRYLADRLIASVTEHGPGDGRFATRLADLAAAPADEQVVLARREIVDHCLYGVDKNPVAAEMAKLSLWLTTMARERPFTFLDHAIQVGDSLLGITDLEQLRWLHLDPAERKGQAGFQTLALDLRIKEATELARRLQELSVVTVRDATEKQRLHDELRAKLADLAVVADTVVGAALSTAGKRGISMEQRIDSQLHRIRTALDDDQPANERTASLDTLRSISTGWLRTDLPDEPPMPWDRQCLHWPLAFPEVFLEEDRDGFDAMVANPPFLGGQRITGAMGTAFRNHLVEHIAGGAKGSADLVAYFLLRMCDVARSVGSLATNTVAQGDTSEVGLTQIIDRGWTVHRAVSSTSWPGDATLEIAKVWATAIPWDGKRVLDGRTVVGIDEMLYPASRSGWRKQRLAANAGKSFQGSIVLGMGFTMSPAEAQALIAKDSRNADVLFPYLGGEDLNQSPTQTAPRWVINFFDWTEEHARQYPDCFAIVEAKVKPERQRTKPNGEYVLRSPLPQRWWHYAEKRPALYRTIAPLQRVLALCQTSKLQLPAFVDTQQVFAHKLVVFSLDDSASFGVLSSGFHWRWVLRFGSTMRNDPVYTPSDVFETFPQPPETEAVAAAGRALDEYRRPLMVERDLGLTDLYNLFHDPAVDDEAVARLRELHVEVDLAVRDAYGWSDLDLRHGFHEVRGQGTRFTFAPEVADEVLDRLLELNKERYEAEVAAGLHDKKAKKGPTKRKAKGDLTQESLL